MAIDTSVSPYFDDYSEDKNFYKVLFKPGVAIQSRELNQTQMVKKLPALNQVLIWMQEL